MQTPGRFPLRSPWSFGLRALLIAVGLVAVPLGLVVNHWHREHVRQKLAQPLIDAADRGNTEAIRTLLDRGADINSVVNGRFPWTPLMHAAFRGHPDVVRLLLQHSPAIDQECLDGFTALTLAASEGHWDIVRLLADHGGDVTHQDATGESALSLAERAEMTQLVEHLRGKQKGTGR